MQAVISEIMYSDAVRLLEDRSIAQQQLKRKDLNPTTAGLLTDRVAQLNQELGRKGIINAFGHLTDFARNELGLDDTPAVAAV